MIATIPAFFLRVDLLEDLGQNEQMVGPWSTMTCLFAQVPDVYARPFTSMRTYLVLEKIYDSTPLLIGCHVA